MFSATFSDEVLTMAEEFLEPGYFSVIVGGSISAAMGVEQAFIQVSSYWGLKNDSKWTIVNSRFLAQNPILAFLRLEKVFLT